VRNNMLRDFNKEKFDIFIQAGQSNSHGFGIGDVEEPYIPNDNVWYMIGQEEEFILLPASETVLVNEVQSDYSLSFSRKYIEKGLLEEGRKILILRTSVGSSGFANGNWGENAPLFHRMLEMLSCAMSLNKENRVKCLLWHQGESDAVDNVDFLTHKSNLTKLLQSVREACSLPELPFIAGDFVQHWKNDNIEICQPIIDAIRAVCAEQKNAVFVETDGLKSNRQELGRKTQCGMEVIEDTIHFSRRSLYLLGERYFQAYTTICKR